MRHKKLNKRLGRNRSQREQLMRSLARALFIVYRIQTTVEKAKEARKVVEKIITLAKSGQLNDIRGMEKILQDRALVSKILKVVAPLSKDRKGGYTRIIRTGFRKGDGANLAILELTDMPVVVKEPKKYKKKPTAQATPAVEAKTKKLTKISAVKKEKQEKELAESKKPIKQDIVETKKTEKKLAVPSVMAIKQEKVTPAKPVETKKQELADESKEEKTKEPKKITEKPEKPSNKKGGLFEKFKGYFKKEK